MMHKNFILLWSRQWLIYNSLKEEKRCFESVGMVKENME